MLCDVFATIDRLGVGVGEILVWKTFVWADWVVGVEG